jgi:phospholipid/cholesterol/gamma-HCH transport system ATP-binding protein
MIIFEHIYKSFNSKTVLQDLSFVIPENKITFILGKSGEGKSVTIKHMLALLHPDYGKITVDNQEITDLDINKIRKYRKKFGVLFQHAALFDSLTVKENIQFPLMENGIKSPQILEQKALQALNDVGLKNIFNKRPSQLSIGEKKRVGLARAIITEPKYLLYDEPTTGMDPLVSDIIDGLIKKLNDKFENLTSIIISHDLKAALSIADNIIMIYQGKVILSGKPDDFLKTSNPIVRQFFSGSPHGPIEF